MKKYLLMAGACILFAAQANALDFRPYVGADMGATRLKAAGKYISGSKTVFVANLNVGAKFNDYFGLEVSSQASGEAEVKNIGDLSYSSIGLDAVGYLPLNPDFELFAMAGVGYYDFDFEAKGKINDLKVHYTKNETAFRAGLGLQYRLNEKWAFRGTAKYHHIDNKYFDYIGDVTVGLRYNF